MNILFSFCIMHGLLKVLYTPGFLPTKQQHSDRINPGSIEVVLGLSLHRPTEEPGRLQPMGLLSVGHD